MNTPGLGKIIYTEEQIQQRIAEIAATINRDYTGQELVVICILKGSFYFVADLTRRLTMPMIVDFLSIGVTHDESGKTAIKFNKDLDVDIDGKQVLLVEDIIGTGFTLGYICQRLETSHPASLKICTLLDNPAERLLPIQIDYKCFTMPDMFVVGYGLDYRQHFRNLPYIAEYRY
ncbi:MAG: hypoxanthine phosphoribosyltransferase [Syntrophomonadaceae bacterium]|nr:hypoxanthine phosphoribosyltransferase [Syntrophomonadaceae bacterium]